MDEELEISSATNTLAKIRTLRVREGSKLSTGNEDEHRHMILTSLESECRTPRIAVPRLT